MANRLYRKTPVKPFAQFVFFLILIFCIGCKSQSDLSPIPKLTYAPAQGSEGACIDVDGDVLGDILSYSNVSLYKVSSVNYTVVMDTIMTQEPIAVTYVNASNGFLFRCLPIGNYVASIPADSYNGSVGSPLPYEFDCPNVSLFIAFQGGNPDFAVGAFSIENTFGLNHTGCDVSTFSCKQQKGRLYKNCPQG